MHNRQFEGYEREKGREKKRIKNINFTASGKPFILLKGYYFPPM